MVEMLPAGSPGEWWGQWLSPLPIHRAAAKDLKDSLGWTWLLLLQWGERKGGQDEAQEWKRSSPRPRRIPQSWKEGLTRGHMCSRRR